MSLKINENQKCGPEGREIYYLINNDEWSGRRQKSDEGQAGYWLLGHRQI
jgi:hypothetical protein